MTCPEKKDLKIPNVNRDPQPVPVTVRIRRDMNYEEKLLLVEISVLSVLLAVGFYYAFFAN